MKVASHPKWTPSYKLTRFRIVEYGNLFERRVYYFKSQQDALSFARMARMRNYSVRKVNLSDRRICRSPRSDDLSKFVLGEK